MTPFFSSLFSLFSFNPNPNDFSTNPTQIKSKHLRAFQHFLPKLLDLVILLFSVLLGSWFLETGEGCEGRKGGVWDIDILLGREVLVVVG